MIDKNYNILFEKYLRGEASTEEIKELIDFLNYEKKVDKLFEIELLNTDSSIDKELKNQIFEKIRKETIRKNTNYISEKWRKTLKWAAVLLLPILSAWAVYYYTQNAQINIGNTTVLAQKGEKAEVVLPDGSKVWVNSGSVLTYDANFNKKVRSVFLQGEAYFEVSENKKRPFIVITNSIEVEALGTSFNVRSYENDSLITAILVDGRVKVSAHGQQTILSINQRATFDKKSQTLSSDWVEAQNFIEWKNGIIYFSNQTFDEIASTLSRMYNIEIVFASEQLRSMRFSGTLGSSGVKNALDILSLTSPMYYEIKDTTIFLHHKTEKVK